MVTYKVLQTVELLENIISFLPARDVLFTLRTCRHFKQVIESSPKLQKMVFLVPDTTKNRERHFNDVLFRCHDQSSEGLLERLLYEADENNERAILRLRAPWNRMENGAILSSLTGAHRMLLTQPPCKDVNLIFRYTRLVGIGIERHEVGISSDVGLTVGDVLACFEDQLAQTKRIRLSSMRVVLLADGAWDDAAGT